ncbi:hypothetical protein K2X85_04245 [bacterium]|nr:hypothetical protein [bacterium]
MMTFPPVPATPSRFAWRSLVWPSTLFLLVILVLYGRVLTFPLLQWDDQVLIVDNPHLHPSSIAGLRKIWLEGHAGIYMPLTYTWWLLLGLFQTQPSPAIYHAGNLLLFWVSATAVYGLLSRMLGTSSILPSIPIGSAPLAGTLLWLVHPLHVESVAWVSEAKGLLALALGVWAINGHLDAMATPTTSSRQFALAQMLYLLSLLAKPWSVAIPFMAMVIDVIWFRRPIMQVIRYLGPWIILGAAFVAITAYAQAPVSRVEVAPVDRPLIALDALGTYLPLAMAPRDLGPDYGRHPSFVLSLISEPTKNFFTSLRAGDVRNVFAGYFFLVAGLLLLGLVGGRSALCCVMLYVAALLPMLGLVPFGFQEISTVADRYALSPMIALSLAFGLLCRRWPRLFGLSWPILGIALSATTWNQIQHWSSDEALIDRALAINDRSGPFWCNRSALLLQVGHHSEAIESASKAIENAPKLTQAYVNRAAAYLKSGSKNLAIEDLEKVLTFEPANRSACEKIMAIHVRDRDYRLALPLAERLAQISSNAEMDRLNVARLRILIQPDRASLGLLEEAVGDDLDPPKDLLAIAQIEEQFGEYSRAIGHYEELLRRDGGFRAAKRRLAWILASARPAEVRHAKRALQLARELTVRQGPVTPSDLDLLAAALAANGFFEEAVKVASQAESRSRELADDKLARQIQQRRELYTHHQPFIAPEIRLSEE